MNRRNHLIRLLRAASDLPPRPLLKPSPAQKARTLAHWRAARDEAVGLEGLPLLRHGLVAAWTASVLLIVLCLLQLKPAVPDAWNMADAVVNAIYAR